MRLTDLVGMRVRESDGVDAGRIRCVIAQDGEVKELVYGRKSMLHALGIARFSGRRARWQDVERMGRGEIVLREKKA